jgi:predicted RNase H-like HicB family nuclease
MSEAPHSVSRLEQPPVFNCVVNVARPDADGVIVARVVNLPGIEGRGRTEREALAQVVPAFKVQVAALVAAGQPIPWIASPAAPAQGESQRLIAVHL